MVLELFPDRVRCAIVAKLEEEAAAEAAAAAAASAAGGQGQPDAAQDAAEDIMDEGSESGGSSSPRMSLSNSAFDLASQGSAGDGSGSSGGGSRRQPVQLVEVVVDGGRPVRLRLASRKELQLEEELGVEVRGAGYGLCAAH
jgi:hypothetical protein